MSKSAQARDTRFRKEAEQTAKEERAIQKEVDRSDRTAGKEKRAGAMQAGARVYPEPPLPKQHLRSRGTKPTWSSRRCTTRRTTKAPRSFRTRWR